MNRFLLVFILFPFFIFAQSKTISGTINDENGSPLPGATVQLKGSDTIGAISDFDGNFTIDAAEGYELTFSFIGFETVSVPASADFMSIFINTEYTIPYDTG